MAYVLTLKIGEAFYVEDLRFEIAEISNSKAFTIHRLSDGRLFQMQDGETYLIAVDTKAFVGHAGSATRAQINLSAPKTTMIDPAENYHRCGGHSKRRPAVAY